VFLIVKDPQKEKGFESNTKTVVILYETFRQSTSKTFFMKKRTLSSLLIAAFFCLSASAQEAPKAPKAAKAPKAYTEKKVRNFDDVEAELDRAEKSLNNVDLPTPPTPPEAPKAEIEKAGRDLARAERELAANEHLSRRELEQSRREMARARKELSRVREVEMPRVEEEMKKARTEIEKAKVEIAKSRDEIKEYRAFEDELVQDGIIDRNNYKLEHREGALYINGKKQSEAVYNKYRSFLDKHRRFIWKKNEEGLNINNGDERL
jgi:hypothetical protein